MEGCVLFLNLKLGIDWSSVDQTLAGHRHYTGLSPFSRNLTAKRDWLAGNGMNTYRLCHSQRISVKFGTGAKPDTFSSLRPDPLDETLLTVVGGNSMQEVLALNGN